MSGFIEIDHLQSFISSISRPQLKKFSRRALSRSIMVVNRNSKIETPVRTGLLRNSYSTKIADFWATLTNFRAYGVFVNARNPFMKRGLSNSEVEVKKIFIDEMSKFTDSLTTSKW